MRKYSDDYSIKYEVDDLGKEKKTSVYIGDFYEINLDSSKLIVYKRYCLSLFAVIASLQVCGGFVANNGMYQFYIAIPYVFTFLALYYLGAGIIHLPKENTKLRRDEKELSIDRMNIQHGSYDPSYNWNTRGSYIHNIRFHEHSKNS